MIDTTKPIRSKVTGLPARIVCDDLKPAAGIDVGKRFLVVTCHQDNDHETVGRFSKEDLEKVFENVPKRVERFVNVYTGGNLGPLIGACVMYKSRAEAKDKVLRDAQRLRLVFEGGKLIETHIEEI